MLKDPQARELPILIVGQGLAGTSLALGLHERSVPFRIIDDHFRTASSTAAAGMCNPVTGRRLALSWKYQDALPVAETFYHRWSDAFNHASPVFHPRKILRIFKNADEQERFAERHLQPDFAPFLHPAEHFTESGLPLIAPFGMCGIAAGFYLDTRTFLTRSRDLFRTLGAIEEAAFAPSQLEPTAEPLCYAGAAYRAVVFCEGWQVVNNPWFKWLPMNPAKGEILSISPPVQGVDRILNKGHWILPTVDGDWRVGATYDHDRLDNEPTERGRSALLKAVSTILKTPPEALSVTGHEAGVRPQTRDNRPLIGRHPELPALFACNGFGSKGSLLAPYFTGQLIDHLINNAPILPEVDLFRAWKF